MRIRRVQIKSCVVCSWNYFFVVRKMWIEREREREYKYETSINKIQVQMRLVL